MGGQRGGRVAAALVALLVCALPDAARAAFDPQVCPAGWFPVNTRCWYYSGDTTDFKWAAGDAECQAKGGRLLSIHNSAENLRAWQLCKDNNYGYNTPGACWLGLYQVQGQSGTVFQWIDGSVLSYTAWAPGEPNNVGGGGEDCVHNWDRPNSQNRWNDEPCTRDYPILCGRPADCPAGSYKSAEYRLWAGVRAQCELCPAGTFRNQAGGVGVGSCMPCPAGTMGIVGETKQTCTSRCPQGFFCPQGTSQADSPNTGNGRRTCPPGRYGPRDGLGSADQCEECAPGHYCTGGETQANPSNKLCDPGQCGFLGQSTKTCNQRCPAGYICPSGTACPGATLADGSAPGNLARNCGGASVFCPTGSVAAVNANPGYYTIGGDAPQRRTGETICEPGYYCTQGVRSTCPGGLFFAESGATSEASCAPCDAGYICPNGLPNSSPRSINCYDWVFLNAQGGFSAVQNKPEKVFCPAGSALPRIVAQGSYSTPTSASFRLNRQSERQCTDAEVCVDGLRSSLLTWDSSECATGKDELLVNEMSAEYVVATYNGKLNSAVVANDYVLQYNLNSFDYFDSQVDSCRPTSPATNQGAFAFINGELRRTSSSLNYEVCLPVLNVRYVALVRVSAIRKSDSAVVATRDCEVTIVIDDVNDKPEFYDYDVGDGQTVDTTVYHRQIYEKVDRNVPVAVCDTNGAPFGCPTNSLSLERAANLLARDEDDASFLRYSIISGDDGKDAAEGERLFKIDPCTGLVSAKFSDRISFRERDTYTYTIGIEDDGNGGRFAPKTDTATLIIHVMDVNDAPVLATDPGTITIAENQPENTITVPEMVGATDEDNDSLTFQIVQNDGDAFKIVNNRLMTTRVGADTINFESSKKEYYIEIEVQDGKGGFDSGVFRVSVVDTNDAPRFTGATVFYVKENALNAPVCADPEATCTAGNGEAGVQTTDEDTDATDLTTYSLNHPKFTIDSTTGVISTSAQLDFEDTSTDLSSGTGRGYVLEVTAKSSGIATDRTEKSTTTSVIVYVVDVNEAPTFATTDEFEVLESWPVGLVIPGEILATDPDNADTVLLGKLAPTQSLSFSNADVNEFFSVQTNPVSGNGEIKVLKRLDYESLGAGKSINVNVRVEDNGGPQRRFATTTINVKVLDANEPPSFESARVQKNAPENSDFVSDTVQATDLDAGETLTYSVIGGNGAQLFVLQPDGSGFKIQKRDNFEGTTNPVVLNYELSSREWTLNVRVQDNGPSALIAASCSTSNPNSCGGGAICQNSRCYEKCYDTAAPNTPGRVLASAIPHDSLFRCAYPDGKSAAPYIEGVATELYKEVAELTYVVVVTDVNDPPRIADCPQRFAIAKNQAEQNQQVSKPGVLDSRTTDEDSLNAGSAFVYPYTFSLVGNVPSFLSISASANYIAYTAASSSLGAVGTVYTPTLRAQDTAGAFSDCSLEIEVVESNAPPTLRDERTVAIDENRAATDPNVEIVILDELFVEDTDDNEEFTFTTSNNPFFKVDSSNGKITLGEQALDYESLYSDGKSEYKLIVQVRDRAGADDVAVITIPVNDLNEAPIFRTILDVQVPENNSPGASLVSLASFASDPDVHSIEGSWRALTYQLVECGSSDCPFQVNLQTGSVTVTRALDFEAAQASWDVTVRVVDGPGLSAEKTFRVETTNVNEAPKFLAANNVVDVDEGDLDQNANLFSMLDIVRDPDADDTPESLVYEITAGNGGGIFSIENGILKGNNNFVLDYESSQEYLLTIRATDSGGLSDQASVRVRVRNVNDVRVTGVAAASSGALACVGGSLIEITGRNLGTTQANLASSTTFTVTYTSLVTGVTYTCGGAAQVVAGDNSKIRCSASAGVGSGFSWSVRVSVTGLEIQGDTSPPFPAPDLQYDSPILLAVTGADLIPTRGGSPVVLSGSCLGSAGDFPGGFDSYAPANNVQYCVPSSGVCYRPSCTISAANELTCTTVAGLGAGFRWSSTVLGIASQSLQAGSYAPPTVLTSSSSTFPSTGVLPDPVVLGGTNFGDIGARPAAAFAFFKSAHNAAVTREYSFLDCVVTVAFEQVTCQAIVPGMGTNMPVVIEFGQQRNFANETALSVQYAPPAITGLSGEGVIGASTAGGQQVIVRGSGFGPACGRASTEDSGNEDGIVCDILKTTYTRGSKRVSDGSTIVYSSRCAVVSTTQIVCVTAPGTGDGHTWTFDLGGHVTVFRGTTTSYDFPTVGAYEGAGSKDAFTTGGQEVIIKGSNFGPLNGAKVTARYGPEGNPLEFEAKDCSVLIENERVRCSTAVGAGDGLQWTLYVDDQESRAEVTDYADPSIDGFVGNAGAVISALNVEGGQSIRILGKNFGPSSAFPPYLDSVSFGPAGNPSAYTPSCQVDSHEQITCTTPPGIGADMRWKVQIKGQSSLLSSVRTSYRLPELLAASTLTGPTEGGFRIRLRGYGLVACDPQSSVVVLFGGQELRYSAIYDESISSTTPIDTEADCPLSTPAGSVKVVEFVVPEMTGSAAQTLGVRLESKLFSDKYLSNAYDFRYADPVLESVYAEPIGDLAAVPGSCAGEYRVTLRGRNFCGSPACCQVYLNGNNDRFVLEDHSHRTISLCTSDVGFVYVKCGEKSTNTLSFNAESPFVFQTTTSRNLPLKDVRFPTRATGTDLIYVWGLYFGLAQPTVTIGGIAALVTAHEELECNDPSIPPHNFGSLMTLDIKCWKTTIAVPDGQGELNELVVASGSSDQTSLANNAYELVNYAKPTITAIAGASLASTLGGEDITISGANFGLLGQVFLLELTENGIFGNTWNPVGLVNCSAYDHEELTCQLPPGEGKSLAVFVQVGNQDTSPQNGEFSISYVPPRVDAVDYSSGRSTEGGQELRVTGAFFGRPFSRTCESVLATDCTPVRPEIRLGALTCQLQSNTQSEIFCIIPAGEGRDLPVVINVRGQVADTKTVFDYAPPEVDYFEPEDASTDGFLDGRPEVMSIFGANFGVDVLGVFFTVAGEEFQVAERSSALGVNTFLPISNHTAIHFLMPQFRGKDILVRVEVAGQSVLAKELFSYRKPTVEGIVTIDKDGNPVNWEGGSTEEVTDSFFSDAPDSESTRRRLVVIPDELELAASGTPLCERNVRFRNLSWRTVNHRIYKSNYFERTVLLYGDASCTASAVLLQIDLVGEYRDVGVEEAELELDCTRVFKQIVYSVTVTPQSTEGRRFLAVPVVCCGSDWELAVGRDVTQCIAQSGCSTLADLRDIVQTGETYGIYLVAERSKLYMSATVRSLAALQSAKAYRLPQQATASLVTPSVLQSPTGPTSGCFSWEPYRDYLRRRREAYEEFGTAINVYRRCFQKSIMTLNGDNFSTNLFNASRQIRVFFYKADADGNTTVEFEAATTSSQGDHPEVCTEEEGCLHEHTKVSFQIPPGYGRNLRIRIQVGNQFADAANLTSNKPILFHYDAPKVDFSSPGSLFAGYGFQNADGGGSTIELLGDDFGGVSSPATVLLNGRACANASWRSGDEDEEGKPFIRCEPGRDVTGPKSLFVCVAGQVAFLPRFNSDAQLLVEADRQDGDGAEDRINELYRDTASVVNSRCKSSYDQFGNALGRMGGMNQLCVECPAGSICNEPDVPFTPPNSQDGYFRLDVPLFEPNSDTVTDRAKRRCANERWNISLLETYPNLVIGESCDDYVSCEPSEACLSGNQCAPEYKYAYELCQDKRYGPQASLNNSCGVRFNPFTSTYEGVDEDCNPEPGSACSPDRPEDCSTCAVSFDEETGTPRGQCECTMPKQCALCSLFTHFRLNNVCKECPNNPELVIVGFVLLVLIAIAGGWYLNKYNVNLALFAVTIDWLQVLGVFSSVKVEWPAALLALFEFLQVFSLNIDVTGLECLVPSLEYETKWYLMETLPLAVLALLLLVHLSYSLYKMARLRSRAKLTSHVARLVSVWLVIMYICYLGVTRKALEIYNCNALPEQDDGYRYTSFTSLSCDGGSLCKCGEGVQSRLAPLAAVFLIIYGLGFPTGVYFAIHRNKVLIQEDQYLRASGIGNTRETNPHAYDIRKKYSALYMHFKPERVFWILTILARKLGVAAAALMFRQNSTFQLSVILLVLFVAFCIHLQYRPYLSTGERAIVLKELDEKAERGLDLEEFKGYTDMQRKVQDAVKKAKEIARRDRTRFDGKDMWKEQTVSKYAKKEDRRRRAAQLFFDYNTVEAVLLASSIFICLGGVMFSSGRFEGRDDINAQRDLIAYLVIICIVLTFIYIVTVIMVEIFPTLSVRSCTRFIQLLQRRKPENHEVVDLDADLQYDSNPMFDANFKPGNTRLRNELEQNQAELDRVAEQNEALRRELRNKKQEDQMGDDLLFGVQNPMVAGDIPRKKNEFLGGMISAVKSRKDKLVKAKGRKKRDEVQDSSADAHVGLEEDSDSDA